MVGPHPYRQRGDRQRGKDQADVAEQRAPGEHRDRLGDHAEVRQDHDVNLRVTEEPEQVLPQQRYAAGGRVEHVGTKVALGEQHDHRRRQHRERQQHRHAGDHHVPGEDRHLKHAHVGMSHGDHGGEHVDRGQDAREADQRHPGQPDVATEARRVDAAAQRGVAEPAERRCSAGGEEARHHRQAATEKQPVAKEVEPGEGHVVGPDLQRHHVVGQPEGERPDEQEQHQAAVHGEDLVVRVVGHQIQFRLGQLAAHHPGEHAGDEEEGKRGDDVAEANHLVIGRRQPLQPPGRLRLRRVARPGSQGWRFGRRDGRVVEQGHVSPPPGERRSRPRNPPGTPPSSQTTCANGPDRRTRRTAP